jgi:hypothetical protein
MSNTGTLVEPASPLPAIASAQASWVGFSQERILCVSKKSKVDDASEWLVTLLAGCSYVSNKGESRRVG